MLGALAGVPVAVTLLCPGDRVLNELSGVGAEVAQGLQDCGVGFAGGQPRCRAAARAVAGAGQAGVVPVGAGPPGGRGADVTVHAVRAGDQPGQVVVGGAGGPLGVLAGPGGGDRQGLLPHLAADQRLVRLPAGEVSAVLVPGRTALQADARRDPLMPYVGDDPGRRGEVSVFVQDGQAMVHSGGQDQVVGYRESLVLALGCCQLGLHARDGVPRTVRDGHPGVGIEQVGFDALVFGGPGDRESLGEDRVADSQHSVGDLLMPGLVHLAAQDPHQGTGVNKVVH